MRMHKHLSRTELGRILRVSPATISHWVAELIDRKLVEEEGLRSTTVGRPTTYVRLRCDAGFVVVADVMRDSVTIAIINFGGEIVKVSKQECPMEDYQQGIDFLRHSLEETMKECDVVKVSGISLIIPGVWDHTRNHLVFSSSLPRWIGMDLVMHLSTKWDVPLFVENDATAAAVGHIWFGGTQSLEDALIVLARWGIGSAVVHAGEVIRGAHGMAIGLGHMVVDATEDEPTCSCGNRGCIEAVLANSIRIMESDADYSKADFHRVARVLGVGCANMINLLELKSIVVVNQSWAFLDSLWPDWVEQMRCRIVPHLLHQVSFQISPLEDHATLLGGAWIAFDQFLSILEEQEAFNS